MIADNNKEKPQYEVGQRAKKVTGDYSMRGTIVGVFYKASGACRYCLEEDHSGLIHIYNAGNLQPMTFCDEVKSFFVGLFK
jgi:hypothetical protein